MNYYNEWDKHAAAWLRELINQGLIPNGHVDERSICDVAPADLAGYTQCHFFAGIGGWSLALQLAGWPSDQPVWTGSCPCQPFSNAGRGNGFSDDRHLWPAFFKLIKHRKPSVIFGEQVASKAALEWLDVVFTDLEGESYACGAADMCAAGILAPQIRPRLWWVSNSNDSGWQGAEWNGQPHQTRPGGASSCGQSLRSTSRPWPPGPGEVGIIPMLADGLPGNMGRCRGYGNAIVPQVAAQFITAFLEATVK